MPYGYGVQPWQSLGMGLRNVGKLLGSQQREEEARQRIEDLARAQALAQSGAMTMDEAIAQGFQFENQGMLGDASQDIAPRFAIPQRMDIAIPPLMRHTDCLMCTRGAIKTCIPPETEKPFVLRCSTGATILKELSNEVIGVAIEDAIRLNASAVTTQCYVGGPFEKESLGNLAYLINEGNRYGIPTLAVTAVGRELVRDSRYLGLACRVVAELGPHFVKTYYCEPGFDEVVAGTPVPIVIAGGKKIPEPDALNMAYKAIDQGAHGVDMGRNIFLAEDPVAIIQAVKAIVHEGLKPDRALEMYNDLKS